MAFWFCGGVINMNMKCALSVVDKLMDDSYRPPTTYYGQKRVDFEFQSYKYSAMNEIRSFLIEHEDEDAISSIEDFRYQMDCFACDTVNGDANFMFSIYYDVATDVLDTLLGTM